MDQPVNVRKFADIMVNRLGEIKQSVFSQKNDIDRDFPGWKQKREEHENEYLLHNRVY